MGQSLTQEVRVQVSGMGSTCSRLENSSGHHFLVYQAAAAEARVSVEKLSGFWAFSCVSSALVCRAQSSPGVLQGINITLGA